VPLEPGGARARHLVAFARELDGDWLVCAVPRLPATLGSGMPIGRRPWRDTSIALPDGAPTRWRDLLSGQTLEAENGRLAVSAVFRHLPVAILAQTEPAG
jgi:(1->4)-alpha-D-glucan 1-alpha-D-glucosylmutase